MFYACFILIKSWKGRKNFRVDNQAEIFLTTPSTDKMRKYLHIFNSFVCKNRTNMLVRVGLQETNNFLKEIQARSSNIVLMCVDAESTM